MPNDYNSNIRGFTLIKRREIYFVKYELGQEKSLLEVLIGWRDNKDLDFDYFDLAVMCDQIRLNSESELKKTN